MLTMIRVFTGENWHEVMHAMSRKNHPFYQCLESPTYEDYLKNGKQSVGCGNMFTSLIFFTSFTIIVSLVFINLFVAIILEGFDETSEENNIPM